MTLNFSICCLSLVFILKLIFLPKSLQLSEIGKHCVNHTCLNGGICNSRTSGFECICGEYHYGVNCQKVIHDDKVNFYEDTHRPSPNSAYWTGRITASSTEEKENLLNRLISFAIKTQQNSGLIFFLHDRFMNYLQVELKKGYLQLVYNDIDLNILTKYTLSNCKVNVEKWHHFTISMDGVWCQNSFNKFTFKRNILENIPNTLGIWKALVKRNIDIVNIVPPLKHLHRNNTLIVNTVYIYAGNIPTARSAPLKPRAIQFFGCFKNLIFTSRKTIHGARDEIVVGLEEGVASGVNVDHGCEKGCVLNVCSSGGLCRERWNGEFTCDCSGSPFLGDRCSQDFGYTFYGNSLVHSKDLPPSLQLAHLHSLKFAFKIKTDNSSTGNNFSQKTLVDITDNLGSRLQIIVIRNAFIGVVYTKPEGKQIYEKLPQLLVPNIFYGFNITWTINSRWKVFIFNGEGKALKTVNFPQSHSYNMEKIVMKDIAVGGQVQNTKHPRTIGNFTGCIHNFMLTVQNSKTGLLETIDWIQQKMLFDSRTTSANKSMDNVCILHPVEITTSTTPGTTSFTMEPLGEYTNYKKEYPQEFDINGVLVEKISESSKSEKNQWLTFPVVVVICITVIFIILLLLVFVTLRWRRSLHRMKDMSSLVTKQNNMSMWSTDNFEKPATEHPSLLLHNTLECSAVQPSLGEDYNPSVVLTPKITFKPPYRAMSVLRSENSYLADSEPDLEQNGGTTFGRNASYLAGSSKSLGHLTRIPSSTDKDLRGCENLTSTSQLHSKSPPSNRHSCTLLPARRANSSQRLHNNPLSAADPTNTSRRILQYNSSPNARFPAQRHTSPAPISNIESSSINQFSTNEDKSKHSPTSAFNNYNTLAVVRGPSQSSNEDNSDTLNNSPRMALFHSPYHNRASTAV